MNYNQALGLSLTHNCPEKPTAIQIFCTHVLRWHSGPLIFPLLVHAFLHHENDMPQVISQCLALFVLYKILPPVLAWLIVNPVNAINTRQESNLCSP